MLFGHCGVVSTLIKNMTENAPWGGTERSVLCKFVACLLSRYLQCVVN